MQALKEELDLVSISIQEALLTPKSEEVYCSSFGFIAKKSFSTFKKDSLSNANIICIAAIFSFFS